MTDLMQILNKANIRPSYQRLSILEVLRSTCAHPTAEEIYTMLKEKQYIGISKATLYNTLQLFTEKGIISQVDTHSSETHYEPNVHFHPHFVCEKCGRIIDIEGDAPEIRIPNGFKVNRLTMNMSGICRDCSENK